MKIKKPVDLILIIVCCSWLGSLCWWGGWTVTRTPRWAPAFTSPSIPPSSTSRTASWARRSTGASARLRPSWSSSRSRSRTRSKKLGTCGGDSSSSFLMRLKCLNHLCQLFVVYDKSSISYLYEMCLGIVNYFSYLVSFRSASDN